MVYHEWQFFGELENCCMNGQKSWLMISDTLFISYILLQVLKNMNLMKINLLSLFASFGLQVLLLPASVLVCVCVCPCLSQVCPCDTLSRIHARITEFGPEVQNTLVKICIALGAIWLVFAILSYDMAYLMLNFNFIILYQWHVQKPAFYPRIMCF